MNASLKVPLTLLALAVGTAGPLVRAQDSAQDEPPKRERREGGSGARGDRLKMMAEHLGLTEEQKTKIGPIIKEEVAALQALRDDASLNRREKRAKMREIHQAHAAQIRAVLTPEQQAKFDERQKRMRDRGPGEPGGAGGADREPSAR